MKRLLLVLALVGCQQINESVSAPYAGIGIDDAFFNQVLAFEVEWGHQVSHVDMFFVTRLEGTEVGVCIMAQDTQYQRIIKIDKEAWDEHDSDAVYKEALIFHEIGHCVLNRDHWDGVLDNGYAASIMNSNLNGVLPRYSEDRAYYMDELFRRKR